MAASMIAYRGMWEVMWGAAAGDDGERLGEEAGNREEGMDARKGGGR